ncbi:hypothetical protein H5410_045052 [Solanum commersonii]|uniref:Uncharacterized protein n=1 Tax=Solanum commersonii TaxID=4109 RepID=A0A9J5X9Y1_SOLCO|nr:hypothetical protein H5410_045052 [Solanum commersonii]
MGDILHAEGATIDITTNTVAEAKAILEACKHCKQSQHNQLADYFANIALDKGSCRYSQFKSIETRGRKILNSDMPIFKNCTKQGIREAGKIQHQFFTSTAYTKSTKGKKCEMLSSINYFSQQKGLCKRGGIGVKLNRLNLEGEREHEETEAVVSPRQHQWFRLGQ